MAQEDSFFGGVEELPPDAIFFTKTRYQQDTDERKVNLGIGAYRTSEGKPYVLKVVHKVEVDMVNDEKLNNEYLPITGDKAFVRCSQELILGKQSPALAENRVAGAQCLSGTGSLRVLLASIQASFPDAVIYISNPTWGNHKKLIRHARLTFQQYRYWKQETCALDLEGMLEDLSKAPRGSFVLLHSCAHNPTGVDPTPEQWEAIAETMQKCGLVPFFDSAYQGFATGDLDRDALSVRIFEKRGFEFLIAQSFAKNLGLYGQRIGCASVVCRTPKAAKAMQTQLAGIIRPMYSNPPKHGAEIVKRVLSSEENFKIWQGEMTEMSGRILAMRGALRENLEKFGTPGTWNHITDQIGMFSFTGITPEQVEVMEKKHHIYMLSNSRISMAGVNRNNVEYIARAIDDVVRNVHKSSKL